MQRNSLAAVEVNARTDCGTTALGRQKPYLTGQEPGMITKRTQ